TELLEDDRFLDETEARATVLLWDRRAGPAQTREVVPGRAVPAFVGRGELRDTRCRESLREEGAGLCPQLLLRRREAEGHSAATRSPGDRPAAAGRGDARGRRRVPPERRAR